MRSSIHRLNVISQEARLVLMRPLLKFLTKIGLTADILTNLRLALAVLFFYIFYLDKIIGSIFMLAVLLLDAIDGSLARFQEKQSDRGKFLDIFADHLVHIFIVFTFFASGASPFLIAYYIFIIAVVYLLGVIKKEELGKSDWIIKPYPRLSYIKAIVVIPFFLFNFWQIDVLDYSLIAAGAIATILAVYYYIYIQIRWKKISNGTIH